MTTLTTAAGLPRRLAFAVDMTFVGTGVASFDYADYSSLLPLRGTPLIVYNKGFTKAKYVFSNEMLRLYIQRFGERNVVGVGAGPADDDSFRRLLWSENVTDLHVIVGGWPDRRAPGHPVMPRRFHAGLLKRVRVHVLRIFDSSRPINSAGNNKASQAATTWAKVSLATSPALEDPFNMPVVPHVVRDPHARNAPWTLDGPNMREQLGIPANATVFCRHGGAMSFDMPGAHAAIRRVASSRADVFFVLQNTANFTDPATRVRNIIHLRGHMERKSLPAFIRTCDAMIHGRQMGEEFGLAIAEFGILHKPVFTCPPAARTGYGVFGRGAFHLMALGERAFRYSSAQQVWILRRCSNPRDRRRRRVSSCALAPRACMPSAGWRCPSCAAAVC